jgi:hypothetical protein
MRALGYQASLAVIAVLALTAGCDDVVTSPLPAPRPTTPSPSPTVILGPGGPSEPTKKPKPPEEEKDAAGCLRGRWVTTGLEHPELDGGGAGAVLTFGKKDEVSWDFGPSEPITGTRDLNGTDMVIEVTLRGSGSGTFEVEGTRYALHMASQQFSTKVQVLRPHQLDLPATEFENLAGTGEGSFICTDSTLALNVATGGAWKFARH